MNWWVLPVVAVCLFLPSCAQTSGGDTGEASIRPVDRNEPLTLSDEQRRFVGFTTARVETRDLPLELPMAGVVQADPNLTTPVNSLVPGRIERVDVQLGDSVRKGQVMAAFRSDEVGEIEADFLEQALEMESDEAQLKVQLELARKTFERKKLLFQEKIAAKADLEQSETEYSKAETALRTLYGRRAALITSTKQRMLLFGIPAQEVERVLVTRQVNHMHEIKSPRSGVVTARDVDPGQMIDSSKTLFVVADLSRVWLVAQVYEKDIARVRLGLPVAVKLDSFPGKSFAGRLDYIGSNIDPQTRTLPVRAMVENPDLSLKPEMFARIIVRTGTAHSLFVPAGAVQKVGESHVVYVQAAPGSYRERQVAVGRQVGSFVEVESGLSAGETVVVKGSLQLLGKAIQRLSE